MRKNPITEIYWYLKFVYEVSLTKFKVLKA